MRQTLRRHFSEHAGITVLKDILGVDQAEEGDGKLLGQRVYEQNLGVRNKYGFSGRTVLV